MTAVTIVAHQVADYDAWKKVYDSVKPLQQAGGVIAHGVLRDESDPNLVIVLHTFETAAKAHAFFDSAELHQALGSAGVDMSTFRLRFCEEVAFGKLQ